VTFNLNLSGQFLRAVAKKCVQSQKTTPTERKNRFFRAVGVEYILRWNSTLKPCRQNRSLQRRDECPSGLLHHLTPLMSPMTMKAARRHRRATAITAVIATAIATMGKALPPSVNRIQPAEATVAAATVAMATVLMFVAATTR
jgi:hypothetical protein